MSEPLPSPRPTRRQREAARRRSELLDVARDVFAEKGFEGAKISEIAAAAEVSLASLYSMFEGKQALYQAVVSRTAERIRDTVRAEVDVIAGPRERLLALIDVLLHCFDENRALMRIYTLGSYGLPWRIRQSLGEDTAGIYAALLEYVTELARDAETTGSLTHVAPEILALSLVGTVNATAAHWLERRSEEPLFAAAPEIRALFERMLVADATREDP